MPLEASVLMKSSPDSDRAGAGPAVFAWHPIAQTVVLRWQPRPIVRTILNEWKLSLCRSHADELPGVGAVGYCAETPVAANTRFQDFLITGNLAGRIGLLNPSLSPKPTHKFMPDTIPKRQAQANNSVLVGIVNGDYSDRMKTTASELNRTDEPGRFTLAATQQTEAILFDLK